MTADLLVILDYLNAAVYVGVGAVAWRVHHRIRTQRSRWLLVTFLTLAVVVITGAILPEVSPTSPASHQVARDIIFVALLTFPYALYRFAAGFRAPQRALDIIVHLVVASLVLATFILPTPPDDRTDFTAGMQAYLFGLLLYWTLVSVWVAVGLWRGGRRQPGVARRRMRLLSTGTIVLNIALLLALLTDDSGVGARVGQSVLAWSSAVLFLLGFAPPGGLRHAWRQKEERRLRRAEATLMTASTAEDVASTIVPHVADLLGGHGAALLDTHGAPLAAQGFTAEQLQSMAGAGGELVARDRLLLPLRSGTLVVQAGAYAPFFGEEEQELLRSLGTFVDLALGRIELFDQELQTRKELERTNDELTALVYGISHDLRSPIVTVMGYLELLAVDTAPQLDDEARHYLDRISVSARYMDALIRDLLELSRIGRTQTSTEPVELRPIVEDIAAELRRKHPAAHFLVGDMPIVDINPVRARQLFTNLMENAVRHGGRDDITVAVSCEPASDGHAVIAVADDGVGIAESYRERVFGIFERLEGDVTAGSGTGIGLAMCRKIVEQVDGSIWIDPAPVGTTFKIALPAVPAQQTTKEVQRQ